MNILQIANKAIHPPDGGNLAILSLCKGYIKNGHNVHLLNMITHKHTNQFSEDLLEEKKLEIFGIRVNTKISKINLIYNLFFSLKPYIANRFISKEFKNKLNTLIKNNNYDFVQIEGLYTLQYIYEIRKSFNGKVIFRPHNLEYLIWKRSSNESSSLFKRIYYSILSRRLKSLELSLLNKYDFIIPISDIDKQHYKDLGNTKPIKTIPFGIDVDSFEINSKKENNHITSISYIGALDWIPNQNGILWFIDKVLPKIQSKHPDVKLHLAGRNAPEWLINKFNHKQICFHGEIENAYDFLQNYGPMIVPLFSGSGMRVKIIEGMALKKAIVATRIATEGIDCKHEKNILISNNQDSFANSVIKLLNSIEYQNTLGKNAREFVEKNYDNKKITESLINFIN